MNTEFFGEDYDNLMDELLNTIVSEEQSLTEVALDYLNNHLEDSENVTHEDQFTIVLTTSDEDVIRQLNEKIARLGTLVSASDVDTAIYYLLSTEEQERVNEHKVARLGYREALSLIGQIETMEQEVSSEGLTPEEYLSAELANGIPFNDEPVLEEQEPEPVLEEQEPEPVLEEQEPEPVVEEQEPEPVRQRRVSRTNDYELAWEIYSLGYSSGDVASIYNTSAGSISRGMRNDGRVMRTGAETRAMRKVSPDEFGSELVDNIVSLLEEKYNTTEEQNEAFYLTFGKNLYELTLHEAEDEEEEINELQSQASAQGISLHDLARQTIQAEPYVQRERSVFVNKVRSLHGTIKDYARELFGDVNVDVGSVDVESKVVYENGVILTVKEAYKIDGKALDAKNVTLSVKIAEYISQGFEREIEQLTRRLETTVRTNFTNGEEPVRVAQFGNRLVVGLNNE